MGRGVVSADNWRACLRCAARREAELAAEQVGIDEDYGQVPVDEFDQRRLDLANKRAEPVKETFREDWEIGVFDDGEFFVSYRGGCSVCDLRHEFKHAEALDVTA